MSEMVDPMQGMAEIVEWLRPLIEADKADLICHCSNEPCGCLDWDERETRCEAELAILDRCEFVIKANEIRDRDERGHYVTNPIARKLARYTIRMLAFGYRRRDGWKDEWAT